MDRPVAQCRFCYTNCEFKKHLTFAYWWCPKCKDEPSDIKLQTVGSPRAERYGSKQDGDFAFTEPGIYKLTYIDGSIEFYEKHTGTGTSVFNGGILRAAKRVAESDLPSRKSVQSRAEASEGTQRNASVGTIPDEGNSAQGDKASGYLPFFKWKDNWPKDQDFVTGSTHIREYVFIPITGPVKKITEQEVKDLCGPNFKSQLSGPITNFLISKQGAINRRAGSSSLSDAFKEPLFPLDGSHPSLQQRELPPDDEL